jgi:phosphoglycerate dehydrogenase-like enzyme
MTTPGIACPAGWLVAQHRQSTEGGTEDRMRIGIIGAGNIGHALAVRSRPRVTR